MKTFNRQDVITIINSRTAYKYIGDYGYFSDHLDPDLKNWRYGELLSILNSDWTYIDNVFGIATQDPDNEEKLIATDYYGLFIPADKVKEVEEKKWRAYKNFDDFDYAVGDIIRFRPKHKRDNEYLYLITGFMYSENIICLNGEKYTFKLLFDEYEVFKGTTWQPFGVEE